MYDLEGDLLRSLYAGKGFGVRGVCTLQIVGEDADKTRCVSMSIGMSKGKDVTVEDFTLGAWQELYDLAKDACVSGYEAEYPDRKILKTSVIETGVLVLSHDVYKHLKKVREEWDNEEPFEDGYFL